MTLFLSSYAQTMKRSGSSVVLAAVVQSDDLVPPLAAAGDAIHAARRGPNWAASAVQLAAVGLARNAVRAAVSAAVSPGSKLLTWISSGKMRTHNCALPSAALPNRVSMRMGRNAIGTSPRGGTANPGTDVTVTGAVGMLGYPRRAAAANAIRIG